MERTSSAGSSIRRRSSSISSHGSHGIDNDADQCESVSEAGDIGDRALPSRRLSESNSIRFSFDNRSENEAVVTIPGEHRLQPYPSFSLPNSSVRPLPPELTSTSSLSTDAIVGSEDIKQVRSLQHFSCGQIFLLYVFTNVICG